MYSMNEIASCYFIIGCCLAIFRKCRKTFDVMKLTSQSYINLTKILLLQALPFNRFYLLAKNIFDYNIIININASN